MFDELSVAENIFMGHMPGGALIDWKAMRAKASALLARIEADFDADTPLKALSVAQKHMVEITRALSHDAGVIIMDEPTAALSRHEIDDLFRIVEQLKAEGRAIVFISHKFDEIFRVSRPVGVPARWREGGRRADARSDRARTRPADGRPAHRPGLPQARHRDRRDGARRRWPQQRDRVRRCLVQAAAGRDPRALRPCRGRPVGIHAGAVRHERSDARDGDARRPQAFHPRTVRGYRRGHCLCSGGPSAAGRHPAAWDP